MLLIVLFFGSIFGNANATIVNNKKITNIAENDYIDVEFFDTRTEKFNNIKLEDNQDIETLSVNYNENINILENGLADIEVLMGTSSYKLADLYKRSLTDSEDNSIILTSKKEHFQKSISMEHFASLGVSSELSISEANFNEKPGLFEADFKGKGSLQVLDTNEDVWKVAFGPSMNNEQSITEFYGMIIGYAKMLLESFEGEQVFKRTWTTEINLPSKATLLNLNELDGLSWKRDFSGGTYVASSVSVSSEKTIIVEDLLFVTEEDGINPFTTLSKYKKFEIKYQLLGGSYNKPKSSNEIFKSESFTDPMLTTSSESFQAGDTFEYENDYFHAAITVNIEGNVEYHLDFDRSWVKPSFTASIDITSEFTASYAYDSDWELICSEFRIYTTVFSVGPVPVEVSFHLLPEYRLEFDAGATLTFNFSGNANGWIKAGIKYSWENGIEPIWTQSLNSGYSGPDLTGEAWVHARGSLSFRFNARFYEIVGFSARSVVYVDAIARLIYDGGWDFKWSLDVGFDLYVLATIGIPGIWEQTWDWKIHNCTIAHYGNADGDDDDPPSTKSISFGPFVWKTDHDQNRQEPCFGRHFFISFNAEDNSDGEKIPSGVKNIEYKFYNDYGDFWNCDGTLNPLEVGWFKVSDDVVGHYVDINLKFRSIDNANNREEWYGDESDELTYNWLNFDLVAPTTTMTINGDKEKISNNEYIITKDTSLHFQGNDGNWNNGCNIWLEIKKPGESSPVYYLYDDDFEYDFSSSEIGTYEITYYGSDALFNLEDKRTITFRVLDTLDPPSVSIDVPKNSLYLNGVEYAIQLSKPWIWGKLTIEGSARSDNGVNCLEISIDGYDRHLEDNSNCPSTLSTSWLWNDKTDFRFEDHTVGFLATDKFGLENYRYKDVLYFNYFGGPPSASLTGEFQNNTGLGDIWGFYASLDLNPEEVNLLRDIQQNISESQIEDDSVDIKLFCSYEFNFGDGESRREEKMMSDINPENCYVFHLFRGGRNNEEVTVDIKTMIRIGEDEYVIFENSSSFNKVKIRNKEINYKPLLPLLKQRILKIFETLKLDETLRKVLERFY